MAVEMSPFFSGANHAYIGQKGGFSLTTMKQPSTLPNPILATENHFIYVYDIYIYILIHMDIDLQMILSFQIFQIFHRPRSRPLSHLGDAIFFPAVFPVDCPVIIQLPSSYQVIIQLVASCQ